MTKSITSNDIDECIKLNILNLFTAVVVARNEDYYKAVVERDFETIKELEAWYRSEDFKYFTLYKVDSEEYIKWLRQNYRKFRKVKGKPLTI